MNGQAITVVTSASSLLGLRDAGHGGARHESVRQAARIYGARRKHNLRKAVKRAAPPAHGILVRRDVANEKLRMDHRRAMGAGQALARRKADPNPGQ